MTKNAAKKTTAKSTKAAVSNEEILAAISALSAKFDEVAEAASVVSEDEDEDDEDDDEEEVELTQEMVDEATEGGIKALRELASSVDIESTKKAEILAAFEELLGDEDEDDEDDEEEDDDEIDEDDLRELSLKDLRAFAKSEEGGEHSAADVKGLDQDALIELIMADDEDDEEDEEEDEDDEEDEDEEEVLDEEALKAMSHKELIDICKELGLKVPTALKKKGTPQQKKLVNLILDSGDEE